MKQNSLKRAVFLDRDGTINEQVGYVNHESRFYLLPGVTKAISRLNELKIPVIIVTNQAGAARGYFPVELVDLVHEKMTVLLQEEGAHLDALYYCPHLKGGKIKEFDIDCNCRKPKTGMLLQAAKEHNIDLSKSYMVGDRMGDVKFAQSENVKGILVLTGYGRGELDFIKGTTPDHVAENLMEAVDWILKDIADDQLA